jgi:hypothetical protein
LFPLPVTISIDPDLGPFPYVSFTGCRDILGQSQSPVGNRATTSTFPYRIFIDIRVVSRADMTGLMTVSCEVLDTATHWETLVDVQVPSAVRLSV